MMKQKAKELELSVPGRLLKNIECEFEVTKGDVGEILCYVPCRSVIAIMKDYANACAEESLKQGKVILL